MVSRMRGARHRAARSVVRLAERVIGRGRMVRIVRLINDEVRRDIPNNIATNGESMVQDLVRSRPAAIVFDVGAHYGEWSTSLAARSGGTLNLHSFEPIAASFERLHDTLDASVTLNRLALSDHEGTASMRLATDDSGSNSLIEFGVRSRSSGATEEVSLSTVDAYAARMSLSRIDLLKVDAEGHDFAVLSGASGLLREGRIGMVQFEYNNRWIDARRFLADAFDLLIPMDYSIGKITPQGLEYYPFWDPELESFREANFLAWHSSWDEHVPTFSWWGA